MALNGTLTALDDETSGEYTLTNSGTNSDNFVDNGSDANGTYLVTEGSAGTYDSTTVGENDAGDYTVTTTSGDTYSYTEILTGGMLIGDSYLSPLAAIIFPHPGLVFPSIDPALWLL
jgi:hypothetical protein